jgi:predicted dehydrogenase
MGQSYAVAFKGSESCQLIAVADVRSEAARILAEAAGCQSFESCEAMSDGISLDAVIVCTPPISHPDVSVHFLDRGIPVLCEKPFSIDLDGAMRMVAAAERTGVLLSMASKFRCVEDVVLAKDTLESGALGEVVCFENTFASRIDMSTRWNSNPDISGGGVLIDNGIHAFDIMRYFFGPVSHVHAVEGKRIQGLSVEETVYVLIRSASGVIGRIDLSWSVDAGGENYINIHGSQGYLSVGWKQSTYRHFTNSGQVVFGSGYDKVKALRGQIDSFARSIWGEETTLVTAEDAIASVEVVEAAYASLRQGRCIRIGK